MPRWGLNHHEWRTLKRLKTPYLIQRFLDEEIAYNLEKNGETCRSPRCVLRARLGHCMEGALLAAAALRVQGFPPLVIYLASVRDDDHLLAVYRVGGRWGAIAKSNYAGLRSREPVYRTTRELAISYFEHYYNLNGEKTLRAYSAPIDLSRFDHRGWMTAEEDLWDVSEYVATRRQYPLISPAIERRLAPMDRRLFEAGKVGRAEC
jgi:hypothetical protein